MTTEGKKNRSHTADVLPPWESLRHAMKGIFERQYYTETGPLVLALEAELRRITGCADVICMANESVACLALFDLLTPTGEVAVSTAVSPWCGEALASFPGLERVSWAPDEGESPKAILDVSAILSLQTRAVVLCGDEAESSAFRACLLRDDVLILNDRTGNPLACPPGADAYFCCMHQSSPLNAVEGAYVATNNRRLADMIRTVRSSSGVVRVLPVNRTLNGRMSEAHAAVGLLSLEKLLANSDFGMGRVPKQYG